MESNNPSKLNAIRTGFRIYVYSITFRLKPVQENFGQSPEFPGEGAAARKISRLRLGRLSSNPVAISITMSRRRTARHPLSLRAANGFGPGKSFCKAWDNH